MIWACSWAWHLRPTPSIIHISGSPKVATRRHDTHTHNLNEIKVIKLPQLARFYVDIIKLSVTCNIITLILFGPPGERKPHHKPFSQIHNLKDQATIVVGRTSHEQPFPMTQTHTKSLGLSPIEHITQQSVRLVFIDLLLTMGRCQ